MMLDQLGLAEFDVLSRWADAPEGTLLQTGYNGPAIGWRCSLDETKCLLTVATKDERDVGFLIADDGDTPIFPALDVSRVLELAISKPFASDDTELWSWRGSVLWDNGATFVQSITLDERFTGYACIKPGTGYIAARVYRELRPEHVHIGKISVRRRLLSEQLRKE